MKKNSYKKTSQTVLQKRCPECGEINEVLESFAYYLKEYLNMTPRAVVTCRFCKKGELTI